MYIAETKYTLLEILIKNILKCGPIPQHLSLTIDGHRRYSRSVNRTVGDVYKEAFPKMWNLVEWCLIFDIPELTIYILSVENYERKDADWDGLINNYENVFNTWAANIDEFNKRGIRCRVAGKLSILSDCLKKPLYFLELNTKHNSKSVLNLAIPYTSRDEIKVSMESISKGVKAKSINFEDVNEYLIDQCMYLGETTQLDLQIRTSGEVRFSGFMLWQSQFANMQFSPPSWPEMVFWDFLVCIFKYQRSLLGIGRVDGSFDKASERVEKFIQQVRKEKEEELQLLFK